MDGRFAARYQTRWTWQRRYWCTSILFLVVNSLMTTTQAQDRDPFSADKLYRTVETYYEFGIHRTATAADKRTGEWLYNQMKSAGLVATYHEWTAPQFFLKESKVVVGDREIESMPYWLPKPTGATPVRAPLVSVTKETDAESMRGKIALVDLEWLTTSAAMNRFIEETHKNGAVGAIFVSNHPWGPIVAQNSKTPFVEQVQPIPSVVVSRNVLQELQEVAARQSEVGLVIEGESHREIGARNVIGKIERGNKWIIVSTPYSGWYTCAGERGPGIAIWLALARWVAERDSKHSYLFVANSGHELGYIGAEKTLTSGIIPSPQQSICWLHLGANIGVVEFQKIGEKIHRNSEKVQTHVMASPHIAPIVKPQIESIAKYGVATEEFIGELINVREHGYPAFGLVGGADPFPWFHTDQDGMDSVEGRNLSVIARAAANALVAIEDGAQVVRQD